MKIKSIRNVIIACFLGLTIPLPSATANQAIEGNSAAFASADWNVETRQYNYCQVIVKNYSLSGTMEAVKKYGRTSEISFRRMIAMKAWKIDTEWVLLNNTATAAGATGTARTLNGPLGFAGITATANSSSTSLSPLSEALLNLAMHDIWNQGADPNTLFLGGYAKRSVSGFIGGSAGRPLVVEDGDRVVTNTVDVYVGDFGRLDVIASRLIPLSRAIVFDKTLCSVPFLRTPFDKRLAPVGDEEKGMIIGELTFQVLNVNAIDRIYRIQSS